MVDCYEFENYSFAILIVQSEAMNEEVENPEIIKNCTITEITDQDVWQNSSIAYQDWKPPKEYEEQIQKRRYTNGPRNMNSGDSLGS